MKIKIDGRSLDVVATFEPGSEGVTRGINVSVTCSDGVSREGFAADGIVYQRADRHHEIRGVEEWLRGELRGRGLVAIDGGVTVKACPTCSFYTVGPQCPDGHPVP